MLTRRAVLRAGGLGALAAVAAACSSSAPARRSTSSGASTGVPASGAPSSDALATGKVVELGARHVAAGSTIAESDARRFGPLIGGRWRGAWKDAAGGSGTSDLLIAVDVRARKVRATIDVGGPILGPGTSIAPVTYQVDLLGFARDADAWTLTSPQLGKVVTTADGGTTLTATATDVPGQPEITSIDSSGTRVGSRLDGRYTITRADGTTTAGTIAWTSSGERGVPSDPSSDEVNSIEDIAGGQYAASFATPAGLGAAMGQPVRAAVANGGRIGYQPGINVSNATVTTADDELTIQYSIYRSATRALTAALWTFEHNAGQPLVQGPWTQAFYLGAGSSSFYAYKGSRVLILDVGPTIKSQRRHDSAELRARSLAVAKVLMPQLNER